MLGTDITGLLQREKTSPARHDDITIIEAPHNVLDITRKDNVSSLIFMHAPDIIINCAAFTNVDKCETEKETAFRVNALGPKYIATAAQKCGARVIHISTDFVFDGNSGRPYAEEDETNPLSEYGRTKLEGERSIQNHCDSFLIVRTSWLFGHHGINFVKKMVTLAEHNKALSVVTDETGSPTYTADLAEAVWVMIEQGCEGIFHAANEESCSRYEWAKSIFEILDYHININPIKSFQYKRPAKVPINSTLDCRKLTSVTGIRLRSWKEATKAYLKKQNDQY